MVAEVSIVSNIASRYAAALFELAQESDALEAVESDLQALKSMIDDSADLSELLRSPLYSSDDKSKALGAVLEKAETGDLARRFVGLVIGNRRAFALRDMTVAFAQLAAAHRGEIVASVTSAVALNDAQVAALKSELSAAMKTDVSVDARVDDAILGGLVVRVGSRMIDSSLRTKLQNLKFAMRGVE